MSPIADDDLVYVDPDKRTVVGPVQFDKNGKPLPKKFEHVAAKDGKDGKGEERGWFRKLYPWGTYRGMKAAFRIDGGRPSSTEEVATIDEALPRLLKNDF